MDAHAIHVRPATVDDVPFLVEGNLSMAAETEDKPLDPATLERGVRGVFEDAGRGFYLVAERDDAVIGCLMVTYEWSDWRDGAFWWIQSVYVSPEARRQGVFRSLYRAVGARARDAGAVGLRLYVELENRRAQQTYGSLGMERCNYHMYEIEFS